MAHSAKKRNTEFSTKSALFGEAFRPFGLEEMGKLGLVTQSPVR
jgi:hypothetical protein